MLRNLYIVGDSGRIDSFTGFVPTLISFWFLGYPIAAFGCVSSY
jgi:hypothetical protein